jgi:uncharacterized membrane protein YsdA (DUF1294 family)
MLQFLLLAMLSTGAPVALFALFRHQVARWPLPGLWWLALGTLCIVLTLYLAKYTL